MAVEGAPEVAEDREVVFASVGDVAANAGVAAGALQGAKAAGDLQVDFHPPEGAVQGL